MSEKGAVACELMDHPYNASGKRRKVARKFRVSLKKEVMDVGKSVGASAKVVCAAMDDEAPEDRGADAIRKKSVSWSQVTTLSDDEKKAAVGANSLQRTEEVKVAIRPVTYTVKCIGSLPNSEVPTSSPTDFQLLYYTLVADGALPGGEGGYLQEFMALEVPARRASEKLLKSSSSVSDSSAIDALYAFRRGNERQAAERGTIRDQLMVAADVRPRKFRAKWQRAVYDGPTARKDAEAAERERWVLLLGNLLRPTDTPMGKLLRQSK